MRINTSLDWAQVESNLRAQMHTAPSQTRKDLARMIGNIEGLVQALGRHEVDMRRNKHQTTIKQQELLNKIEEAILDYEKWLMFAYLGHG
jgi:hypothetical protein